MLRSDCLISKVRRRWPVKDVGMGRERIPGRGNRICISLKAAVLLEELKKVHDDASKKCEEER